MALEAAIGQHGPDGFLEELDPRRIVVTWALWGTGFRWSCPGAEQ
jgi:hypothetical protein